MAEEKDLKKLLTVLEDIPQMLEGIDLEALEDGSIKLEDAAMATRRLTETLAGLYATKRAGRYHPDLDKIPSLEEALLSLEGIPGMMAVREETDLRCRIETAPGRFEDFNRLLQEAENTGPIRLVGKLVEFTRPDGSKGAKPEFLPEVNMPRGIPPKVWEAQVSSYNPQTKETALYFPRNWRNEDHLSIAKALRGLYQRAREGHRELKAGKDAQREAEKPYFEQSTLLSLDEALVKGKEGVIAFGFNYREQYSDKPPVRGVVVVEATTNELIVKDLTPSFEEIEGLERDAKYPFTAGEMPDLRRIPRTLRFMMLTVLNSIRKKTAKTPPPPITEGTDRSQEPEAAAESAPIAEPETAAELPGELPDPLETTKADKPRRKRAAKATKPTGKRTTKKASEESEPTGKPRARRRPRSAEKASTAAEAAES